MRNFKFVAVAACLALVLAGCAIGFAFPDDIGPAPPFASPAAPDQPFASFVPGATKAWCDSLPYPYCEDPAPGTPVPGGHAPDLYLVLPHPIFGG
jgi:hypothetical protein